MNKKIGLFIVVIAVTAGIFFTQKKTEDSKDLTEQTTADTTKASVEQADESKQPDAVTPVQTTQNSEQADASANNSDQDEEGLSYLQEYQSIPEQHKLSLVETTQRVFRFAKRDVKSQDLISEFEQKELSPELRVDSNPYTGTLNVVRTRKVLPGTRYFHAQFFENEDGSEYVQHVSFEFKASEHSFAAVEKTILRQFGTGDVEQTQNKENFKSWRRDDGYIVWMKKLDATDIKDNPFNVYTEDDVGTIRVAIELDIHDHSPAFHAEQGPLEEEE